MSHESHVDFSGLIGKASVVSWCALVLSHGSLLQTEASPACHWAVAFLEPQDHTPLHC